MTHSLIARKHNTSYAPRVLGKAAALFSERRQAPGPRGHWLWGVGSDFAEDPLGYVTRAAQQHGPIVRMRFLHHTMHLLTGPDQVRHVTQERYESYSKEGGYAMVRAVFGEGSLTLDGARWRKRRRIIQPSFKRKELAGFAPMMTDTIAELCDAWQKKPGAFDVEHDTMKLALLVAGRAFFSADVENDTAWLRESFEEFAKWFDANSARAFIVPWWLPTPGNVRLQLALRRVHKTLWRIIESRRSGAGPKDLVSRLIAAVDEETGARLSNEELLDESVLMMFAGHETTGVTMAWALWEIASHPEVQAKLQQEVARVVGDRVPTAEDVAKLDYTRMVVSETLRLYPPAWLIGRQVEQDDVIDGYHLAKGSGVLLCTYATQRDPRYWHAPNEFDPTHFASDKVAERHKFAYFPFNRGPRQCAGNHFAMLEAQLFLAMVVQRFHLHTTERKASVRAQAILRPADGVWLSLTER